MRNVHVLRLAFLAAAVTTQSCKIPIGEGAKTDPGNGTGSVNNWNPVTGNSFAINFTNTATGTPGSYPILVTASGPGLTSVSITITINVS